MHDFVNKVKILYETDNIQNHVKRIPGSHTYGNAKEEFNPDDNWWIYRLTRYSAIYNKEIQNSLSYKSYNEILLYKDVKDKTTKKKSYIEYYIPFDTKKELLNFFNYVKTYFCRICLYCIQTSPEIGRGELRFIPWFDFRDDIFSKSSEEIDMYLFKKYGIDKAAVKHIQDLIPNYYGLDLSKYN